jgi:hypothetical protein
MGYKLSGTFRYSTTRTLVSLFFQIAKPVMDCPGAPQIFPSLLCGAGRTKPARNASFRWSRTNTRTSTARPSTPRHVLPVRGAWIYDKLTRFFEFLDDLAKMHLL